MAKKKKPSIPFDGIELNPEIEPMWNEPLVKVCESPQSVTINQMAKALQISHGIVGFAARYIGVNRNQMKSWIRKNPELQRIIDAENDNILDIAEGRLYEALAGNETWAIKYVLDTKGKKRGWTTEYIAEPKVGELLKSIDNLVDMDEEEMLEYDQEQLTYNYK